MEPRSREKHAPGPIDRRDILGGRGDAGTQSREVAQIHRRHTPCAFAVQDALALRGYSHDIDLILVPVAASPPGSYVADAQILWQIATRGSGPDPGTAQVLEHIARDVCVDLGGDFRGDPG